MKGSAGIAGGLSPELELEVLYEYEPHDGALGEAITILLGELAAAEPDRAA